VEMNAIRKACMQLKDFDGEPYEPKITFITVQKVNSLDTLGMSAYCNSVIY